MVRQRLIRDDPPLPDEVVLVRSLFDEYPDGQTYDRAALITDAILNFDTFGYYGLSLWETSDDWPLDAVLSGKARKARRVALYLAGEFRSRGLDLLPSGKAPHVDVTVEGAHATQARSHQVMAPSVEELVDRFLAAAYTVVDNFYFVVTPNREGRQG